MLYGRPEYIINTLIQKVRSLPAPKEDKLESLVDFSIAVRNLVATVKACKLDDHLYNVSLRQELVERLPFMIKLTWGVHIQNIERVTLDDFSDWLYSLAQAASAVNVKPHPTISEPKRKGRKEDGFLYAHREPFPTPEPQVLTSKNDGCVICQQNCGAVEKCSVFTQMNVSSRWAAQRNLSLCRRCLKIHGAYCRRNVCCGVNGCTRKHHPLLHNDTSSKPQLVAPNPEPQPVAPNSEPQPGTSSSHVVEMNLNTHRSTYQQILFRYVPVVLYNNDIEIHTHAFLDDGSSLTLLEEDLAEELQLEGISSPLCLHWTADTYRYEDASRLVSVQISSVLNPANKIRLSEVHTVKQLKLPPQSLDFNEMTKQYHHLQGLPINSYHNARPRILIGINNVRVTHSLDSREGKIDQPVAAKTRLGWVLFGRNSGSPQTANDMFQSNFHVGTQSENNDCDLHNVVKYFFTFESLGIAKSEQLPMSKEEERAFEMMRSQITFRDGRYEMGLLWKYEDVRTPDTKYTAMKRFHCLERRMRRDPLLAEALRTMIKDYVKKRYARKLTEAAANIPRKRKWYLPMFPVFNPNKPGKLRIVWDAAAATNGISHNSLLLKGPDQLTELPAVLYKFREHLVAIGGDIREMFHQVLIKEDDQHCQRFLWREHEHQENPDVYVLCVMSFGATCSPSCAIFVKNENADRFRTHYPAAVDAIKGHYVDDMLLSV
ncbi:uncharacterized protein LOC129742742 [Uranotaenia lowii]|uniref:uncharacterized protein LOC129742742 n=1 Tax=Uranotaenia lowii TaxID=190385 RepID=UPI002478BD59|nr:uncharacterized protein LOC129742742 [Uranotaenia lowii]